MKFVVFLRTIENKPIDANCVMEEGDYIKFYFRVEVSEANFWKNSCDTYELRAAFNKADVIGYEKIFGE